MVREGRCNEHNNVKYDGERGFRRVGRGLLDHFR